MSTTPQTKKTAAIKLKSKKVSWVSARSPNRCYCFAQRQVLSGNCQGYASPFNLAGKTIKTSTFYSQQRQFLIPTATRTIVARKESRQGIPVPIL